MMLLSLLVHQQEAGDPELLEWIKHQFESVIGLGPGTIVVVLGMVIALIPVAILLLYFAQRRRGGLGRS